MERRREPKPGSSMGAMQTHPGRGEEGSQLEKKGRRELDGAAGMGGGNSRSCVPGEELGAGQSPAPGAAGLLWGDTAAGWGGTALSLHKAGYVEQMELSYSY